jgi:hypothetical protein
MPPEAFSYYQLIMNWPVPYKTKNMVHSPVDIVQNPEKYSFLLPGNCVRERWSRNFGRVASSEAWLLQINIVQNKTFKVTPMKSSYDKECWKLRNWRANSDENEILAIKLRLLDVFHSSHYWWPYYYLSPVQFYQQQEPKILGHFV